MSEVGFQGIDAEFKHSALGNRGREKRLRKIALDVFSSPSSSFPEVSKNASQATGLYRFISNDNVSLDSIITGHQGETVRRCQQLKEVLVAHDSTVFTFPGDREGLGPISGGKEGFIGHMSLAISSDGLRQPLGILAVETLVRDRQKKKIKDSHARKKNDPARESLRWSRGIAAAEKALNGNASAIHITDREGDIYECLSAMHQSDWRYVVRCSSNRNVADDEGVKRLFATEGNPNISAERTVKCSQRKGLLKGKKGKKDGHPPRDERTAKLSITAGRVAIQRPQDEKNSIPELPVNVVYAREVNPPEGEDPVTWTLYTTEPIESKEEILRVIDIYRARWVIEEYFKSLKTGCRYEARQLESIQTLRNALGILIPIAWALLALRHAAHTAPETPASQTLNPVQIAVLQTMPPKKLSANASSREAYLLIAGWGGHLPQNGPPGWQVLWRGMRRLLEAETAWRAALAAQEKVINP